MHLEGVSESVIPEVNIPTGAPRRYRFRDDLSVVEVGYLGDVAAVEAAAASVARQAGG
jgi:bisphosphoglycerate-dependent phosphoglycerate mutase